MSWPHLCLDSGRVFWEEWRRQDFYIIIKTQPKLLCRKRAFWVLHSLIFDMPFENLLIYIFGQSYHLWEQIFYTSYAERLEHWYRFLYIWFIQPEFRFWTIRFTACIFTHHYPLAGQPAWCDFEYKWLWVIPVMKPGYMKHICLECIATKSCLCFLLWGTLYTLRW